MHSKVNSKAINRIFQFSVSKGRKGSKQAPTLWRLDVYVDENGKTYVKESLVETVMQRKLRYHHKYCKQITWKLKAWMLMEDCKVKC